MRVRSATDVGLLIRDRRKRAGWSQTELARRVGASRNWVSEVERGKPSVEFELVLKALQVLGVSLDAHDRGAEAVRSSPGTRGMDPGLRASVMLVRDRGGPMLTSGGKPLSAVRRGEDA